LRLVQRSLVPSTVLIHADGDKDSILYRNLKILNDIPVSTTECKAFVCKDFTCSQPISDPDQLREKLGVEKKKK
jgi:uncharacterized protein YyaL (SSP411 family)